MPWWTNIAGGLRALLGGRSAERDMDEELRGWLDAATERYQQRGMSLEAARRAAHVEMGSMESVKEEVRAVGWESAIESLLTDLRFSLRVLAKSPLFTAVVVVTLALGIGANTAIFSLIDTILLRSLPVRHPEELIQVTKGSFTNPLWEQVRDRQDVLSGAFAWSSDRFNLTNGGIMQFADSLWVSGDFFRTLGLTPAAGRLLSKQDDVPGCPGRAVLSYGYWQSHYGGSGSAIGSTISLSSKPFEIVGVVPSGFFGLEVGRKFDVAVPLCSIALMDRGADRLTARSSWWLSVAGRMKPGISFAQASARLAVLSPAIYGAVVPQNWDSKSQENFRHRVLRPESISTGLSGLRKTYEDPLRVLMYVVGLVLLIACANIAGLLTARAAARGREMAMRQALGASRFRLMRQLLTECLLLAISGALVGMLFARWGNQVLVRYLSTVRSTAYLDFSLDTRVLGFTAGIAVVTSLLFGIVPALRGTRESITDSIKETHASDRGMHGRFRLFVVGAQVALSLVLLVTAGLLLHSFRNLAARDLGFDHNHVLLVNAGLVTAHVPQNEYPATYDRIEDALRALPGVTSVSRSWRTPLANFEWNTYVVSDVPNRPTGEDSLAWFDFVSPPYFDTLRTPLIGGRNFTAGDTAASTPVAVINQTMARKFFPGVNPIGHIFQVEGGARKLDPPVLVIGISKDAKYESVKEDTFPAVFGPATQYPSAPYENFEIRTAIPAAGMTPAIQRTIAGVNKLIPIEIHTLATQVDESMMRERLLATLAAFFGGLALLLAMIGLYGTLAYLVTQRRIEFGIRMALGAQPGAILRLVLSNVAAIVAGGIAVGVGLSLAATRTLGSLLWGLKPWDAATMAACAALLAVVSFAASLLAARRAVKLDPMTALRHD